MIPRPRVLILLGLVALACVAGAHRGRDASRRPTITGAAPTGDEVVARVGERSVTRADAAWHEGARRAGGGLPGTSYRAQRSGPGAAPGPTDAELRAEAALDAIAKKAKKVLGLSQAELGDRHPIRKPVRT